MTKSNRITAGTTAGDEKPARNGSTDMEAHVNAEAFRRARLINGKVFIDAEKAFHECAVSTELGQLALEVALMGDLMEELGLKVTGLQMEMFLEEIIRQRERRSGDDAELARELTELEVDLDVSNCAEISRGETIPNSTYFN